MKSEFLSKEDIMWLTFWKNQGKQLLWTLAGYFLLIYPCLRRAWSVNAVSIKDGRKIDAWKSSWLNSIYGNPEDGVSGQQATVFTTGSASLYRPASGPRLRAYFWSALRNSCDALKYKYRLPSGDGPMVYWWKFRFGYQLENSFNVPVVGFK